jgi:MFS family permease
MSRRRWLRLGLVGLGASIVPFDTAVNIGFPDITRSFSLPIQMIQWVVICYVLTYASLLLAFGRAGDIFGHARVFRIGLAWSVVAFMLCSAAPTYPWLLFCRFLQGIGAGLVISVAPALVTEFFPEHHRSRAVAAFTAMFAVASAAGPLIGGVLVSLWGWSAVFWFRAPIALAALVFLRGLPRSKGQATRQPLDLLGAVLLALTISSLVLFVDELPGLGRQDWRALPLFVLGAAAIWGFLRREARSAAPILHLELFADLNFATVNIASILIYLTSFSVLLFAPYYLVRFSGLALPQAGGVLAASFVSTMAASAIAGRLIERTHPNAVATAGAVCGGVGLIAIGSWSPGVFGGTPAILAALILQGFGAGLFQVAYTDRVIGAMPANQRGVAGGLTMLTRTLGIVGGATLLTLLFHVVETSTLASGGPPPRAFLTAFKATLYTAGAVSIATGAALPAIAGIWSANRLRG